MNMDCPNGWVQLARVADRLDAFLPSYDDWIGEVML